MMRTLAVAIMISAFLASCAYSAKKKSEAITALEESLRTSSKNHVVDTVKIRELLADYDYFYKHYPKDSLCPGYLMRAGDFHMHLGEPDKAIECYRRIYTEYPTYGRASVSLFAEAFMYDNEKHNYPKAKELYTLYLQKYPNTKMARNVEFLLEHLGETPEQTMMRVDSARRAARPAP